jgi:carbon storage regulator CsrA
VLLDLNCEKDLANQELQRKTKNSDRFGTRRALSTFRSLISNVSYLAANNGVWHMLVLTRKSQEKIQIGDNITITILRVKGQTVRVGIDAPRSTKVIRGELPPMVAGATAIAPSDDNDSAGDHEMAIELPASISPRRHAEVEEVRDSVSVRRRPLARFAAPALKKMANFTTQPTALLTPVLAK